MFPPKVIGILISIGCAAIMCSIVIVIVLHAIMLHKALYKVATQVIGLVILYVEALML